MIAYLNGTFLPIEQAAISPMDRGFLFGDSVYEVIPVYGGRIFRLSQHLDRLEQSLSAVYISPNEVMPSRDDWQDLLNELVEQNGGGELGIYLQITRGEYGKRAHVLPTPCQPTVFAYAAPLPATPKTTTTETLCAITAEDIRWQYCHIKTTSLMPNLLMQHQATLAGVDDVILIREGLAQEAAAANLFVVQAGKLLTPPKKGFILGGITRDLIIELAASYDIPCEEKDIPLEQLYRADEIWLTSSTLEVRPVTRLDQHTINNGKIGPYFHKMQQAYQQYKTKLIAGEVA